MFTKKTCASYVFEYTWELEESPLLRKVQGFTENTDI